MQTLRASGLQVIDISVDGGGIDDKAARSLSAMATGVDVVFQATLRDGALFGFADSLTRVDGEPSRFGPLSYGEHLGYPIRIGAVPLVVLEHHHLARLREVAVKTSKQGYRNRFGRSRVTLKSCTVIWRTLRLYAKWRYS